MFLKIKQFLNKLTTLSKILLFLLLSVILLSLIYFFVNIRYIKNTEILIDDSTNNVLPINGFTMKNRFQYTCLNIKEQKLYEDIIFQTTDLKIYKIEILIKYNINKNKINSVSLISNKISFNDDDFSNYILNNTINYSITDLSKNNKQILINIIKNYFDNKEYQIFDIKEILIISPYEEK